MSAHDSARAPSRAAPSPNTIASARRSALAAVLADLRCPVCATQIGLTGDRLRCIRGHSFDITRKLAPLLEPRTTGTARCPDSAAIGASTHFSPPALHRRGGAVINTWELVFS